MTLSELDEYRKITAAVSPIINAYVKGLSPVQWSLVIEETPDLSTTTALTDLCADLFQTIYTRVTEIIKLMITQKSSCDNIRRVLRSLSATVGTSLSDSFAEALNVPQEKCESIAQLTALIEKDITDKAICIANTAMNSSDGQVDDAIILSMFSSKTLDQMVPYVSKYLKESLMRLTNNCHKPCWCQYRSAPSLLSGQLHSTVHKLPSPQSVKSKISLPAATTEVSNILVKWASQTPEQDLSSKSDLSEAAMDTAIDLVEIIVHDLHYASNKNASECSDESNPPQHHFNVSLIVDVLRNFFASLITKEGNECKSAPKEFQRFSPTLLSDKTSTGLPAEEFSPPSSSSEKSTQCVEICGAVNEIQEVITTMLSSPEENDTIEPGSPEVSSMQTSTPTSPVQTTSPCEASPHASMTSDNINMPFRNCVDSRMLITKQFSEGKCNKDKDRASPDRVTFYSPVEYLPNSPVPEVKQIKEAMDDLMIALLLRSFTADSKSKQDENIKVVVNQLTQMAKDENKGQFKKVRKAVFKDIVAQFSSIGELAEAAGAPYNTGFDEALLKSLHIHLNSPNKPKKKSRAARFFSAVGKVFMWPIRACCK